nr:hypothetical protein [Tanacetum cinerariifolium]
MLTCRRTCQARSHCQISREADVRRTCKLRNEGLSSGGNKLNSIFITIEVTFTKPKQPTDTFVSPPVAKESNVTLSSTSLEFLFNTIPTSSTAALDPNEECVNAMVDGSDHEMKYGAANAKPGSKRVSFGTSDVVVALSTREKGDGFVHSSIVNEEGRGAWYAREHLLLRAWGKLTVDLWLSIQQILTHATRPKPNGFPLGPLV